MATSSITQNIVIKAKHSSKQLISALENAENKSSKDVDFKKLHREIRGKQIREFFK